MSQYNIGVSHFQINKIRSLFSDTLVASVGLRVMNAEGGLHQDFPAQSENFGDHGSGDLVNTNLFYTNVDVPDPTSQSPDGGAIFWNFLLANAGHVDLSVIVNALNNTANAVAGALIGSGNILGGLGVIGGQALLQVLTADCDGVVAALALGFTAAELAQMTADPNNTQHEMPFPGTDSPTGCGSNSNYDVTYSIVHPSIVVPLVTVPDLIGESPEGAAALVQQAGLLLSTVSSQTGGPNEAPHVDSQDPAPGSQVPGGTLITAFVIDPVPPGHEAP
jgi:hypothetical protein